MYKLNYLKQKQGMPLILKERLTESRIREWYSKFNGEVYVAFSGGKDSTVLLDCVRRIYPSVQAVFVDTGLEYPEIRDFVKTIDNVTWLKPKLTFKEVIDKYGYPVISKRQAQYISEYRTTKSEKLKDLRWNGRNGSYKISEVHKYLVDAPFRISHKCCAFLKKKPFETFEKETNLKPFIGTMADDSDQRELQYLTTGCNAFDQKKPASRPISVWLEKDIWEYIKKYNIPYSKIYDLGYARTGCIFCLFGVHLNEENKFQKLAKTHPKQYNYCINKLGCGKVLDYINIPY